MSFWYRPSQQSTYKTLADSESVAHSAWPAPITMIFALCIPSVNPSAVPRSGALTDGTLRAGIHGAKPNTGIAPKNDRLFMSHDLCTCDRNGYGRLPPMSAGVAASHMRMVQPRYNILCRNIAGHRGGRRNCKSSRPTPGHCGYVIRNGIRGFEVNPRSA